MRSKCSFRGCVNVSNSHGLCVAHGAQKKRGTKLKRLRKAYSRLSGKTCEGPECSRPANYRGLCTTHTWQAIKYGRSKLKPIRPTGRELLETKLNRLLDKRPNGCWLWTGAKQKGYAIAFDPNLKKIRLLHRIMKERQLGVLLESYQFLDHICRVRNCVNPDHLDLVTRSENTKRMLAWRYMVAENQQLKRQIETLKKTLASMDKILQLVGRYTPRFSVNVPLVTR